ncbi:hypothetical protein HRI_003198900 [Hibiscus trionum]|uniref:Reverse transcriptase domain-containing protein n=1 Tax=Hibiscus trionum TaxID=183268 RepID=A0A9W7IHE6_HIBTR|nr:hypothetical protein HRI_003198900 [Hibiscus trionum]
MKFCMNSIIGASQFVFTPGRQILDCIFIANEGIDHWRKKGLQGVVFKVDFRKAYDLVEWPILIKVMEKWGLVIGGKHGYIVVYRQLPSWFLSMEFQRRKSLWPKV